MVCTFFCKTSNRLTSYFRHSSESSETTSWDVEAGRSTTMPQQVLIPRIEANRLNPYASTAGDPLSTKQLLQSNEYRISYLELLPECFFSLRAHCKTSVGGYYIIY